MINYAKGFTLIELMIVVAIIGLLVAIAIPALVEYQRKAQDASAKADVKASMVMLVASGGQ